MKNSIKVPFLAEVEKMTLPQLEMAMETGAAKSFIGCVNWDEYPYRPDVAFSIARSHTHLAVLYHVRGLDLRAAAMQDNGRVWEDSCCEMFLAHPTDGTYYNFEMNCVGTLLAAKRTSRNDASPLSEAELGRIIRHTTLEKRPIEESEKIFSWSVGMCVPFELIGVEPGKVTSIRGNFYKCGDLTAHPHFLSWSPIGTPTPDFHRPEFFGDIVF